MSEEKEYFVHILNWPVSAESPEEAAKTAGRSLKSDPTGFVFSVTDDVGTLVPSRTEAADMSAFKVMEYFDSEEWYVEEEQNEKTSDT